MTISRVFRGLPYLGLATAAVIIALLVRKHRDLSRLHRDLRMRMVTLGAGDFVPAFRTRSLAGDSVTIGQANAGDRQTFWYSPKNVRFVARRSRRGVTLPSM